RQADRPQVLLVVRLSVESVVRLGARASNVVELRLGDPAAAAKPRKQATGTDPVGPDEGEACVSDARPDTPSGCPHQTRALVGGHASAETDKNAAGAETRLRRLRREARRRQSACLGLRPDGGWGCGSRPRCARGNDQSQPRKAALPSRAIPALARHAPLRLAIPRVYIRRKT